MPVKTIKRKGRHRIVEADTGRIAKNKAGTPVDGGGHAQEGKAKRQANAINRGIYGQPAKKPALKNRARGRTQILGTRG